MNETHRHVRMLRGEGDVSVTTWSTSSTATAAGATETGGKGTHVLLLHGFTQTAHSFVDAAAFLVKGLEADASVARPVLVHGMSLRGHGRSSWTASYSRAAMAEDVEAVANALGLESFFLVGMSLGASVSVEASMPSRLGSRVRKLVLIDWAPIEDPAEVSKGVQAILMLFSRRWDTFEDAVAEMHMFNPRRSLENLRDRLQHQLHKVKQPPGEDDAGQDKWRWNTDPSIVAALSTDHPHQWEDVARLTMPVLLVRGAVSDVLSPERAAKLARTIPNCKLVEVSKAGHSVAGDNPEEFARVTLAFWGVRPSSM